MTLEEGLLIQYGEFQAELASSYAGLRQDTAFTDVTLACEDGSMLEAHRLVLATSTTFFLKVLGTVRHPHPLVYMRGLSSSSLSSLLDFLYLGEARVEEEEVEEFLAMGEQLGVRGLLPAGGVEEPGGGIEESLQETTLNRVNIEEEDKTLQYFEDKNKRGKKQTQHACSLCGSNFESGSVLAEHTCETLNTGQSQDNSEPFLRGFSFVTNNASESSEKKRNKKKESNKTFDELDAQIYGNMSRDGILWICNFCDKKDHRKTQIMHHLEKNHLDLQLPCDKCGHVSNNRLNLAKHKLSHRHKNRFNSENIIPHKEKEKNNDYDELDVQLNANITKLGDVWCCNFCNKQSNKKAHMRDHLEGKHMTLQFACDSCAKLFGSRESIRKHKGRGCNIAEDSQKTKMDAVKIEENEKNNEGFDQVPFAQISKQIKSKKFSEHDAELNQNMAKYGDIWYCNSCDKTSISKSHLISHLEVNHITLKFPCDTCTAEFRLRDSLRKHKSRACNYSVTI